MAACTNLGDLLRGVGTAPVVWIPLQLSPGRSKSKETSFVVLGRRAGQGRLPAEHRAACLEKGVPV